MEEVRNNKKRNKRLAKRMMVLLLVFIQFITLFSPFVAYADEGEGVEEEEESSLTYGANVREGNVYSEGNSYVVDAFEKASKYDPYVHYINTYSILMSGLDEQAKSSPYSNVTKGNIGNALKGSGSKITEEYDKRETSVSSVFEDIENSQGIDTATGDEAAGDAMYETPIEEEISPDEKEKLEDAIAEDLTDAIMGVLSEELSIGVTGGDVDFRRGNHGYDTTNSWFTQDGDKQNVGSGFISIDKLKIALGKNSGEGKGEEVFREALNNELKKEISSGGLGLNKVDSNFTTSSGIGAMLNRVEKIYEKEYAGKGVNVGDTGLYARPWWVRGGFGNKHNKHDPLTTWDDAHKDAHYLIVVRGYTKDEEAGQEVTKTNGVDYMSSRYMWTYDNLPVDKKDIGKKIVDAYNGVVSSKSGVLKQLIDDNKVELDESIRIVSWTPIYPYIIAEGDTYAKLQTKMEKADSNASVSGNVYTFGGETRTLQGMDLYIDTKNYSPVLIGSGGKGARLHVGSENGETNSGERMTSGYVWYKVSPTNKPKKSSQSDVDTYGSFYKEEEGNYLLGSYTQILDSYMGSFASGTVAKPATIGVDNYGNVINGETGDVIVPYWHNHMFEGVELNKHYFPYSPTIKTYGEALEDVKLNKTKLDVKGLATDEEIEAFVGGKNDLYQDAITIKGMLEGDHTIENSQSVLENGYSNMSQEAAMRGLAVVIASSTEDAVKDWNTKMLADAKTGRELYVSNEPLMTDKSFEDDYEQLRWTAASLIQRIGWIMDYGFSDVLRLTVVSNLTRTYNTTVADAGLSYIFYTDNITNSEGWANMAVLLATVIGAVISAYILLVGFKAYRGDITWTNVVLKVLVLAGVLFYPMFVYGNLVDYTINKPTEWIMGNQMRLSAVLDTYFVQEGTTRGVNEFYENMFGKYPDSDAMQLGSYNITFYTTTDKNGFDINTTKPTDSSLTMIQGRRLERYQKGIEEYPKNELVSVQVPLTDLYRWAWDVRYNGEGLDSPDYGRDSGNSDHPDYDDVVGTGKVPELFVWLANGGSSYFGVEGYTEELATYEEYKIMPETVAPLKDKNQQDVLEMKGNSTYGAGVRSYKETLGLPEDDDSDVSWLDVEATLGLEVLSGSELFYNIVQNSSMENVDRNLGALEDLSTLATTPKQEDTKYYIPTSQDLRALVRDLSTTNRGREYWYGSSTGWSNFTRATLDSTRQGTGGYMVGTDGVSRELANNPNLIPPNEDFLGLTYLVEEYQPNRGDVSPYKRTTLEHDVMEINLGLLNNYLSTYSITKQSLGADEGRNKDALNHSEKMVMATEAYFQFNDALGWNHFPQTYAVDSIKFDKYMALVYIPFKDYGQQTMTFYDDSEVIPMSTAEYIGMTEGVIAYGFFAVTIIALIIFGLFYIAVLYFGLLFYSLFNFVKFYVIKSDFQNKSALGSMMILVTMSLSKIGIMLVVWATSWLMNKTIALSAVNKPSYNTTILHSIAITGVIVVIFMYVIRPTWKGVMGDKENMGGQFFADKVQDVGKKLTSGGFMQGRGKGVEGGSQASKFKKKNKGTGDNMRNNAGRLGNIDEKGLGRARKQAGGIGGAFGFGGGQGLGSNTKRRVGKVRDALQRTRDKKRGINRTGRKLVDPSKVKAKNLVERMQLIDLGKTMNNIVQTTSGLASTAVDTARVGQELANFQTGTITTMAMGSAGAAAIVAKNLVSQGIKARADGENVLFDSSGYDLEDQSVRSELFNNSVAELQDQNILKHANVQKGKVDGSTAVNYDYSRGDSRLGLTLDEKTGIHPDTFNQLAQTQEFKDLFIAPRENELTYDAKGNIIGLPDGGLRLVNPQMSATEVQNKMNNLYKADNKIREENNLVTRDDKDKNGINIEGMDEKYYNENIAPIIKDQRGMYSHGSRIVYDKMNPMHQSVINQINKKVDEYNTDVEKGYGSESNNLMRYVVNDGDNQGIITETVHGDDNKVLATMVHGTNDYKQKVSKFKVNDSEVGQIGDNVEAVSNLRNVALNDRKLGRTVNEFTEAKKDMRTLFTNEVNDMSANDRVTFSQEMMGYLDQTQIGNTPEFKTVKSNLHSIEQQFRQNEISEAQYHDLVRRENDNLTKIMDSTGKLDGFILNRYDGSSNPYINKYEEKAKAKTKGDKKKYKKLTERYNESVDKLDKKVGRKNLMEMPLGVVENTVSKNGEEYQLDGKGVLVQRTDARRKRNSFNGKDSDSVMSYLMKRPIEINDMRKRKLANK